MAQVFVSCLSIQLPLLLHYSTTPLLQYSTTSLLRCFAMPASYAFSAPHLFPSFLFPRRPSSSAIGLLAPWSPSSDLYVFSCSACSDHSRFRVAFADAVEFRCWWIQLSHCLLAWYCITVLVSLYGRDLVDPAGLFSSVLLRGSASHSGEKPARGVLSIPLSLSLPACWRATSTVHADFAPKLLWSCLQHSIAFKPSS
jgi:hypothetical protein